MSNKKVTRYKKIMISIFIACFAIQLVLFFGVNKLSSESQLISRNLNRVKSESSITLVKDTVREQQRKALSSIRQGWVQYLQLHPSTEVILKDSNGNVIFSDGKNTLSFNSKTMTKTPMHNSAYEIRDSKTNSVLLKNARPQWDKENVYKIFSVIACPVKAFGNGSNIVIFDSYTGEVIVDTRDIAVSAEEGKRYISGDYKNKNKDNIPFGKNVFGKDMMIKKDSDRQSEITSLYNESKFLSNPLDYEAYPLGEYNRDFVEKIILPYEFVGESNENMQITVSLSSSEKDIFAPYSDADKLMTSTISEVKSTLGSYVIFPNVSIVIGIITALISLSSVHILNLHISRNSKNK